MIAIKRAVAHIFISGRELELVLPLPFSGRGSGGTLTRFRNGIFCSCPMFSGHRTQLLSNCASDRLIFLHPSQRWWITGFVDAVVISMPTRHWIFGRPENALAVPGVLFNFLYVLISEPLVFYQFEPNNKSSYYRPIRVYTQLTLFSATVLPNSLIISWKAQF